MAAAAQWLPGEGKQAKNILKILSDELSLNIGMKPETYQDALFLCFFL